MEQRNIKRIRLGGIIVSLLCLALAGRLYYIQILCHEDLAAAARSQYDMELVGLDTRGQILDRSGQPLTGGTDQFYYIIKRSVVEGGARASAGEDAGAPTGKAGLSELDILLADLEDISGKDGRYCVYRTENYNVDLHKQLVENYDAYVFRCPIRYQDEQTACHLIGYLNESEQRGVSGLELLWEERLQANRTRLLLTGDAAGNILRGLGPRTAAAPAEFFGAETTGAVATTIDKGLQTRCEELLAERSGSGAAIIVTAAESGEVLALASYPVFNPNDVAGHLVDELASSDCLVNKVTQGEYAPGSVFKLVVAAAALENKVCSVQQTFNCEGQVRVQGVTIQCSTAPDEGHGELDMTRAMAVSCNCYFAQLGEAAGYEQILAMARQLGFGQTVFPAYPDEGAGNLPDVSVSSLQDTTNLSIGQGRLLATPLQVAKLTGIIASGGVWSDFVLLKDDGENAWEQEPHRDRNKAVQMLSLETASALQDMMVMVMTEGTAAYMDWQTPVWGKSGTAEATWNGQPVKHCWFTGFCEVDEPAVRADAGAAQPLIRGAAAGSQTDGTDGTGRQPDAPRRCTITVLVERGTSGSASALPIYRDIVNYLTENPMT